jgi:hypothetical protein
MYLQTPTHFDNVIERLERGTGSDEILDRAIYEVVTTDLNVLDRLRFNHARRAYTSSLDAFILIPPGWWWHISHLGAHIIPNSRDQQIPISNAIDYGRRGQPVEYSSRLWGDEREKIPRAVAAAALIAHRALFLKRLAIDDKRMYLTQTGNGPRLILPDGRITDLPYHSWLTAEGKLVARAVMFPPDPVPEIIKDEDDDDPGPTE